MLKNRGAKKLGEVCLLYDGPFGSDLLAEDYDEQGVPLLRMQNITETGSSNLEDVQLISQESAARMDKYHVFPGELVVTKIGFLGHSTVLPNDYPVYVFRREMTKMIPKKPSEFLPEALAAYFNGKFGRDQFYRYASGTTRDRILLISQREVLVPPLSKRLQLLVKGYIDSSKAAQKAANDHINYAEQSLLQALGLNSWQPPVPLTYARRASETLSAARIDAEYFAPRVEQLLSKLSADGLTIHEVAPARHESFDAAKHLADTFDYIEISGLRSDGTATSESTPTDEAPSRASQLVRQGDIITSTVRPIRRLSAIIAPEQDGHVCSSGFVVLDPTAIAPEVMLTYLRLPIICELMDLHTSASLYPAISERDLLKLPIPRIADKTAQPIITQVRQAHAARQQAQALLAKAKRAVEVAIEEGEKAALILLDGNG